MPACAPLAAACLAGSRALRTVPRLAGVPCTARTTVCCACGAASQSSACVVYMRVAYICAPPVSAVGVLAEETADVGNAWMQIGALRVCTPSRGGARRGQSCELSDVGVIRTGHKIMYARSSGFGLALYSSYGSPSQTHACRPLLARALSNA